VQIVAAFVLFGFGWRVETIGLPGLGGVPAGSLSLALTVAWVVFVTNALNLIDGLDGLAGGVALVAAVASALLLGPDGGAARRVAVALAGALAGFLWFNLSPALIFMGDAGSLFVGFVLAALTLRAGAASAPGAFPTVPMLLLAVPLLDTTEAIRRRVIAAAHASGSAFDFVREVRRRVFAPDGLHVHHRLVKGGLSTRRAVLVLWAIAASFAVTGWLTLHWALAGVALAAGFALTSWRGLGALDRRLAPAVAPAPLVVTGTVAAGAADDEEIRRAA
jgi:UDP-GlcNAc:undecaprenyl-phosphate GlcNAc-1-phosphate transferase